MLQWTNALLGSKLLFVQSSDSIHRARLQMLKVGQHARVTQELLRSQTYLRLAESRKNYLESSTDVCGARAVLGQDPQSAGADAGGPNLAEGVQQAGEDGGPQLGISLHDLPHKEHHVQRRAAVGVTLQR